MSLIDLIAPYSKNGACVIFQSGPLADRIRSKIGISVYQDDFDLRYIRRESGFLTAAASTFDVLELSSRIGKLAKNFDLIYANTLKASIVGLLAGLWSNRPTIVHLRDILSEQHFSSINRVLFTQATKHLASAIVTNSKATANAYIANGGDSSKVTVIYPGFEAHQFNQVDDASTRKLRQEFGIAENMAIVGCFSRISRWKGQDILLKSFAQQRPSSVLLLVGTALFGEDEFLEELRSLGHHLKISDRVIFTGFRNDPEKLMSLCDVVVHPSSSPEPFGRAVVEAQLSGRVVIGTNMGGITEIIEHGKTGLLVPIGDSDALAATLASVLDDPAVRRKIGAMAQSSARERFSITAAQAATSSLIARVIRG